MTLDSSDGTITFDDGSGTNDLIDGDQLATVILVGDNAIDLGGAEFRNTSADGDTLITVDASVMTEAVTLDIAGGNDGQVETYIGGSAVDTVTVDADTDSGNGYGWPKMWKELVARGHRVGKERVRRLMKLHGIRARCKSKFVVNTDSKHYLPIFVIQQACVPHQASKCAIQTWWFLVVTESEQLMGHTLTDKTRCRLCI